MGQILSRPKEKIKILLLEGISDTAVNTLTGAGYTSVERLPKALEGEALREALKGISMVGIRSRTRLNAAALDGMRSLVAIGCFSVGTNQVDLDAARHMGIPVFNAPFSNTRSVAELTIAEIVMLYRRVFPKSVGAHAGGWEKTAEGANEIRGKTLGIVGYGNIGSQLAVLAEAMGMRVIYYDRTDKLRHGNTEPKDTLDELLAASDVVSLHVPETPETKGMIGEAQFRAMKPGAYFINNARGTVYDVEALARALKDKHLAGAAVDVFPVEPKSNADRFELAAAGPRQRHPHAACRRLDAGGAGAHRLGGGAQAGRIFRRGLDARRGEFPAGSAAAAPGRARASSRCIGTCPASLAA